MGFPCFLLPLVAAGSVSCCVFSWLWVLLGCSTGSAWLGNFCQLWERIAFGVRWLSGGMILGDS